MNDTTLLEDLLEPAEELASPAQRFVNYLIDIFVFYLFLFLLSMAAGAILFSTNRIDEYSTDAEVEAAMGGAFITYLVIFLVLFLYYTLTEGTKGKTLGKLITKTRVVCEDGEPMTFGKAFLRTLCRLVPFEAISIFTGSQMWHDKWTGTMVVKDRQRA